MVTCSSYGPRDYFSFPDDMSSQGTRTTKLEMAASPPVSGISSKDLEVEELNVTSTVLLGAAHHFDTYCGKESDAFMECRIDTKDPRKCLQEGKAVTQCALDFFRKIKGSCNEAFAEHWNCLDHNNQEFPACRKTQKAFDACMAEKLGLNRDS